MPNRRTALYRHYDNGVLLYVGQSYDQVNRFLGHQRCAEWAHKVTRTDTEYFPSKLLAVNAERIAIKSEKPKFNILHNKDIKQEKPRKCDVEIKSGRYGSFYDLTDNEKRLFIACSTIAKETNGEMSLNGRFIISAYYFSSLFGMEIDDAFEHLQLASKTMMQRNRVLSNGSIKSMIGGRSVRQSTKTIMVGFNGNMTHITNDLKTYDDFLVIMGSLELHDKYGCSVEYWSDYFIRLNAEREAKSLAYLEKHNCVGQAFDAIYNCASKNNDCDMGSFMAPSSMINSPPPCESCGGETVFDCMYE